MKWTADKKLGATCSHQEKIARRKRAARKRKRERFLEGFAARAHEEHEAGNICDSDYNGYGYIARRFSLGKPAKDYLED